MATTRRRRILRRTLWSLLAIIVLVVGGTIAWSQIGVMSAEPAPLAQAKADPALVIRDTGAGIVLSPADGESTAGLVFIPGAKVQAEAYIAVLQDLAAQDGLTIVITRPWLNLAFFDLRGLDSFTSAAPDIGTWMVGGHSLGGVRACQLAADADALVLFASYCANDLSGTDLPVLSLSGTEDGLSTPQKIADARRLLPADAQLVEIPGASHSSFGDYGAQSGDGTPTISDAEMRAELTDRIGEFTTALH
jgi:pimeloyl-ACP methyl ester carboxylesterase